jgi:hypothetical protein
MVPSVPDTRPSKPLAAVSFTQPTEKKAPLERGCRKAGYFAGATSLTCVPSALVFSPSLLAASGADRSGRRGALARPARASVPHARTSKSSLTHTEAAQSLPSPANDVGFNPKAGRDAAPRSVHPTAGKRKYVGAIVIFTKQFGRFPGWRFTI